MIKSNNYRMENNNISTWKNNGINRTIYTKTKTLFF